MILETLNTIAMLCAVHGGSISNVTQRIQNDCQYQLVSCIYKTDSKLLPGKLQECIIERYRRENK